MASNSRATPPSTSTSGDSGLPDFTHPPVDETALSIQFGAISGFNIPHFGLFYDKVRGDYPTFEVQQPILNVMERPGPVLRQQIGLQFSSLPEVRCWFIDKPRNRLIQIQHDRFVHNWRRVKGDEEYPRYPKIRSWFQSEWTRFCEFLASENLEAPKINQCEVTYVNNIEYGQGWSNYGELDKVIANLATPKRKGNKFLPDPERINMQVTYIPDQQSAGRLHVSFTPVIRVRDGKEVLQMTLTARGAPQSPNTEDAFRWLDMGRRWVVRGFADFTTEEMHRIWGRK